MSAADTARLAQVAHQVRRDIITMIGTAGSGHPAGALGMADVMTALYYAIMRVRPEQPDWSERDYLLLSNGHIVPALYAVMARRGYFPVEELASLRQYGSRLQGHPERTRLPGIESTSGPLGSGLSQAAGVAYAWQHLDRRTDRFVYCLMGDGELDEGNIWEAAMFAAKYRLGQLIGVVDRNNIQIDGTTDQVMPLGDLAAKWRSFGWHVQTMDGHNFEEIISTITRAQQAKGQPSLILAHTIPGKGVAFMERDHRWHGQAPTPAQLERALAQLGQTAAAGGVA